MINSISILSSIFFVTICCLAGLIKLKGIRLVYLIFFSVVYLLIIFYIFNYLFDLLNLTVLIFATLQIFNVFRIYNLRYKNKTIMRVIKNGLTLTLTFFVLALFYNFSFTSNIFVLCLVVFTIGFVGLCMIFRNSVKIKSKHILLDSELPTVSVLIPARNEDSQLASCIESVIDSDYPKLEILVLDDCSQDKSSEIIKSFAQKGVRFIQGDLPKENWLAKNQAYDVLSKSASGDYYLFMGVDVRIDKKSIRTLMTEVLEKKIYMAGMMPSYLSVGFKSIFYTLRYYWELVLPRYIMRHPPAVSTCWLIHDEALKSCGGFSAVSQSVLPERYFALQMKNKYRFYRNSRELGVSTNKTYKDQLETSQRLLYPQLRKSITRVFLMTLLSVIIIMQYFLAIVSLINKQYQLFALILLSLSPALISTFTVSSLQGIQYRFIRSILLPFLLVQELFCAYVSAYKYEFSEVIWKGRNVCYPSLKVIPRLPKA